MRKTLSLASVVAVLLVFSSCATTDYVGKTYAPTDHVDIFFPPMKSSGHTKPWA